jgi:dihydroorotate dehydrogenase
MIDYNFLKNILFKFDPETAHSLAEFYLSNDRFFGCINNFLAKKNFVSNSYLTQEVDGIEYKNPVGLGAGFDKNATMMSGLLALGFGFLEIGTFTPLPQSGNAKPRLFRYPKIQSLQNAMGFNNDGMLEIYKRVEKKYPFAIPLGINIGKNKITPPDMAIDDYKKLTRQFKEKSDFFIVNISSPNTPGLRDLQNEEFIKNLLIELRAITNKPIYIKLAPDLDFDIAFNIVDVAIANKASGIIATNTSNDYSLLSNAKDFGGLSGAIITQKSREFFKELGKNFFGKTTLISRWN